MAKNRRKLIDDVKKALAALEPGATDRDFAPILRFVLASHNMVGPSNPPVKSTTRSAAKPHAPPAPAGMPAQPSTTRDEIVRQQ